jgi:cyclase
LDLEKRPALSLYGLIAIGLLFCAPVHAKENAELTKLAEGVYARIASPDSDAVSNAGVIVLDHCVLVFDTHYTPEAGQALLDAIRSITSKPIRYVVNSHSHTDHILGNQVFADAQIIGSTDARREVMERELPLLNRTMGITRSQLDKMRKEIGSKESGGGRISAPREIKSLEDNLQTMSRLKILPPVIALDDRLVIQDGKQDVQISFLGPGHTDGDIVLYLPAMKIVFVGDLFFETAIPNVRDAHILQWMKTLSEILLLNADKFVPGHGKPGSRKDVAAFLAYFEELKAMIQPAVERGDSLEQVLKDIQVPEKYSSYRFQHFFPANVQKMYAELKELQISAMPDTKSKEKPTK